VRKVENTESVNVRLGSSNSGQDLAEKIITASEVLGHRKGWGNGREVENIARDLFSAMSEGPDEDLVVDGALILDVSQTWMG
jgi:hypothetical protein